MKKRRYSITKEQAEIIRLALETYIEELNSMIEVGKELGNSVMYETWRRSEAQIILDNIKNYQWEV